MIFVAWRPHSENLPYISNIRLPASTILTYKSSCIASYISVAIKQGGVLCESDGGFSVSINLVTQAFY